MIFSVANNDSGLRQWRLPILGVATSALLHAALWAVWLVRNQEPEPTLTPAQVIEVSLLTAKPQSVQQPPQQAQPEPPQPAVKPPPPPPPKPEKPPEKPAPKGPAKPKPTPKKQTAPELPKQEPSTAPAVPVPAVEAPPAPAPAKPAAPAPFVEASYKSPGLNNPPTRYPAVALERRWEGTVTLRVQVLPGGTAGEIRIERSSGHEILDDATVEQVRTWRFLPARRGDQAVASWVVVPIEYKIKH